MGDCGVGYIKMEPGMVLNMYPSAMGCAHARVNCTFDDDNTVVRALASSICFTIVLDRTYYKKLKGGKRTHIAINARGDGSWPTKVDREVDR